MNFDLESLVQTLSLLRDFERMEKIMGRIEAVLKDPAIKDFVRAVNAITDKGRDGFPQVSREFSESLQTLVTQFGAAQGQILKARIQAPPGPPAHADEEPEPAVHNPDMAQALAQRDDGVEHKPPTKPRGRVQPIM